MMANRSNPALQNAAATGALGQNPGSPLSSAIPRRMRPNGARRSKPAWVEAASEASARASLAAEWSSRHTLSAKAVWLAQEVPEVVVA